MSSSEQERARRQQRIRELSEQDLQPPDEQAESLRGGSPAKKGPQKKDRTRK